MNAYTVPGFAQRSKDDIIQAVIIATCADFEMPVERIYAQNRRRENVEPRQIVMYILSTSKVCSLKKTGRLFGRDHTTALYARKTTKGRMDVYPDVKNRVERIKEKARVK